MSIQIHRLNRSRIRAAHHPPIFRPDQCAFEVLLRLVLDVLRVDAEADRLPTRVGGSVPKRLARIVPNPPFLLHVIGIRNLPVRSTCKRNSRDGAILPLVPNTARREIKIRTPDFLRLRDLFTRGALRPIPHHFRTRQDGIACPHAGSLVSRIGCPSCLASLTTSCPR